MLEFSSTYIGMIHDTPCLIPFLNCNSSILNKMMNVVNTWYFYVSYSLVLSQFVFVHWRVSYKNKRHLSKAPQYIQLVFRFIMAGILDLLEFIFAKPLCLLLLTSVVFLNLHCSFGEKNSYDRKNWNNEQVKCGRVISSCAEGGNELFISYKYNQPVDKWERCSWIVAIPNATSFTIEPILNGLKTPATGLVALGINDEDDLVSYNL